MDTMMKTVVQLLLVAVCLVSCSLGENGFIDFPSKEEAKESSAIRDALLENFDIWDKDVGLASIYRTVCTINQECSI